MNKNSTLWRYTALQVPGWILVACAGWWTYINMNVPIWLALGILLIWIVKDYALYPFLRFAYETNQLLPVEKLIGKLGTVVKPLIPDGYIKIHGELWRAKPLNPEESVEVGNTVKIIGFQGITLLVETSRLQDSEQNHNTTQLFDEDHPQ